MLQHSHQIATTASMQLRETPATHVPNNATNATNTSVKPKNATNKQTNNAIEARRFFLKMQQSNPTGVLYVMMHPVLEFLLSQMSQ